MSSVQEEIFSLEHFTEIAEALEELSSLVEISTNLNCSERSNDQVHVDWERPDRNLRKNSPFLTEVNSAVYNQMFGETLTDLNKFCEAAEDYALQNMIQMEDAFKPEKEELEKFGLKFLPTPFFLYQSSFIDPQNHDDAEENCVTLEEIKHLLPSNLVYELQETSKIPKMSPTKFLSHKISKPETLFQNCFSNLNAFNMNKIGMHPRQYNYLSQGLGQYIPMQPPSVHLLGLNQTGPQFGTNMLFYSPPMPPPGFFGVRYGRYSTQKLQLQNFVSSQTDSGISFKLAPVTEALNETDVDEKEIQEDI